MKAVSFNYAKFQHHWPKTAGNAFLLMGVMTQKHPCFFPISTALLIVGTITLSMHVWEIVAGKVLDTINEGKEQ